MRKSHECHELSERICATRTCNRRIKARMVAMFDARICYRCLLAAKRARQNHVAGREGP